MVCNRAVGFSRSRSHVVFFGGSLSLPPNPNADTHEVLLSNSSCSVGVTRLIQPRTHATTTATIGCGAQRYVWLHVRWSIPHLLGGKLALLLEILECISGWDTPQTSDLHPLRSNRVAVWCGSPLCASGGCKEGVVSGLLALSRGGTSRISGRFQSWVWVQWEAVGCGWPTASALSRCGVSAVACPLVAVCWHAQGATT